MQSTLEERKKVYDRFKNLRELKNVIEIIDKIYIFMKNASNKDPKVYFT